MTHSRTVKKTLSILFLSLLILFSCSKDDDPSDPVACFTIDVTETTDSTHLFLFDQCPPAYDLSYWDFGDGQYSSNPNPSHIYNHYGSYNVTLTVTSTEGKTSTTNKTITVGHYSLDKIVYRKTTTNFVTPINIHFDVLNSSTFFVTSILTPSSLPVTHQLADNTVYDLINSPSNYMYVEDDTVVSTPFLIQPFNINPSQIINKQMDIALDFTPFDTAKFTMYFKIVPR